ncbi:hypothetical protein LOCC1_G004928 [Lachnellula occidentalis]|uniref:WSC domain-containing protein n=1 Tax=Lachnellula occidentalis TaxID=215460 RepID=A0A8H8UGG2_9HELO|nr:hypothetical protein LOCC1_G004928 [Lachnellula occidentalis]
MLSLHLRRSLRLALAAIFLTGCIDQVSAANIEYCSGLNTADSNKNSSIYQSNGLCSDFCRSSYAFAVVQDDGCWCSNYVPGTTTSGCSQTCPGYPLELCGGDGVYGYIALENNPSGTKGASSAAASSTTPSSTPSSTTPEVTTVTATPNPVTIVATLTTGPSSQPSSQPSSSSTSDTPTTQATTPTPTLATTSPSQTSTTSSSSSPTWTPTPVTSLETVTGEVRTVTITPTSPPNSATLVAPVSKNKNASGISTGGAVGLTIGLVALVAIISAIVYFCLKKRRKDNEAERLNPDTSRRGSSAGLGGPIPSRTMSENSRYVLGTNGREVVEAWEADLPGSRKSRLVPVDPRLDPFSPVYQRACDNKSRESVNTIRDDLDYSRRINQQGPILRATNPDT